MFLFAAGFEPVSNCLTIQGKYLEHIKRAIPDYSDRLMHTEGCIVFSVGRGTGDEPVSALPLLRFGETEESLRLEFGEGKRLDISGGLIGEGVLRLSRKNGWLDSGGRGPLLCFADRPQYDEICESAKRLFELDALLEKGDYKSACMLYAPLSGLKKNPRVWDNADLLYRLGRACSKLSTTLLIKAGETKKLRDAAQYRAYAVALLARGAELEPDSARCATALAYRYYSNVHELMRPGERRDQDLEKEIELANEWLSRALEIYPQSVKNNYRKGKLIIEKQAPYLLFGKHAYGAKEAALLREIREVGEEHLASAIALYESKDAGERKADAREYAKALFVLGSYYLDDAYLPVYEYFCHRLIGDKANVTVPEITKLNIQSACELLEKCFNAETDMPLTALKPAALTEVIKEWTRSPVEKLYRLGCAYSARTFIALAEGRESDLQADAKAAERLLTAAKAVADSAKDRKRNTWHISEKISWLYIYLGKYAQAAGLLARARSGYIVNTRAIALMLTGKSENIDKAREALRGAAADKNNLAAGLSKVLYAYTLKVSGQPVPEPGELSARNGRLAEILGMGATKRVKNG